MEGEDTRHTSLILRKRRDGDIAPVGAGPELAESLARQVAAEAQPMAYFASGRPFTRRWSRLRRNIGELLICRRYASVRDMADALLQSSPAPRLGVKHLDKTTPVGSLAG